MLDLVMSLGMRLFIVNHGNNLEEHKEREFFVIKCFWWEMEDRDGL